MASSSYAGGRSKPYLNRGYELLNQEIAKIAEEINRRRLNPPLAANSRLRKAFARKLMALHRLANFCMVTSLHDGMSLVAKEFVASRSDTDGVLFLSNFTGAAREVTSTILINPFSVDEMAAALRRALEMLTVACEVDASASNDRKIRIMSTPGPANVVASLVRVKRASVFARQDQETTLAARAFI